MRLSFLQETQWSGITTTGILLAARVEIRVKGAKELMHLKSYAIDGRLLCTGSANWSPTGLKRQDNDVLYESSPVAVERFERKFEEMWGRAGNTELLFVSPSARSIRFSFATSAIREVRETMSLVEVGGRVRGRWFFHISREECPRLSFPG